MSEYSLIKQLQNPPTEEKPRLPRGLDYQEYVVEPQEGNMTVFIPIRETEAFEEAIKEHTVLLRSDVRRLLRAHRGIIG
jgi:hypothetical protein